MSILGDTRSWSQMARYYDKKWKAQGSPCNCGNIRHTSPHLLPQPLPSNPALALPHLLPQPRILCHTRQGVDGTSVVGAGCGDQNGHALKDSVCEGGGERLLGKGGRGARRCSESHGLLAWE